MKCDRNSPDHNGDDDDGGVSWPGEHFLLILLGEEKGQEPRLVFFQPLLHLLSRWGRRLADSSNVRLGWGSVVRPPGGFASSSSPANLGMPPGYSQPQSPSL